MKKLLLLLTLTFTTVQLSANSGATDEAAFFSLERSTLEDILNAKTSVSTLNAVPLRESPGLVTVITREEIQSSGARDLIDVLRMVPELEFGADGWGNVGLAIRGNWANEGKVLLLWDGQIYNDPLYTNIQFDRFPVDQIERIEIIKGPGSVIYGGYAELAVINIKTRSPKELNGGEAYAAYGLGRARARDYAGYSFGKALAGGTEISGKAFWSEAQRSDRRYTDLKGDSYNMNGASYLHPKSLNLYASRKGLSLRLITDDYFLSEADGSGDVLSSGTERISFNATFAEAKYEWRLSDVLRLEPRVNLAWEKPWAEDAKYTAYDKSTQRYTGALTAFYEPGPVSFVAGGEYYRDSVRIGEKSDPYYLYADGSNKADYRNLAFFGQGTFILSGVNFTFGGRYDKHSNYDASFVPRLAATRLWDRFSLKAIYSRSFRAPSIENMRLNPGIVPEKTSATELEAGYKAAETLFLTGNIFQTEISDPILYYSDPLIETYTNYDRTGTNGFGLGAKFKRDASRADLNYAYYNARGNRVDSYNVPGHGSYLLGVPKHKVTFSASLPAGTGFSLNPSATYISRMFGYASPGSIKAFRETVIANLNLQLKDRPVKHLTLNLGVRDIFKSGYSYLQAYTGGHAPLPAPSRELFVKAAYEF